MKKRAHERIPLDMEISFLQSDTKYSGTVKDISKNGMYIETDTPLPFDSKLDLHMPFKGRLKILIDLNNEVLEVPVQVKRLVQKGISCNVDNSDGLYTRDINTYIPSSPEDKILIVGVNHVDTGKTTYVSHSVVNDLYHVGVVAVNDDWLRESALEMAGITDINDPRYSTYSQLYAFT
ncbi:MAG TPA: PilZ domain-containing protein, partial [Nitrospirae bacterium]|nr:PilZ domain-containing protein [Nitrospirota bacterium]